jgi:hypothetical protein
VWNLHFSKKKQNIHQNMKSSVKPSFFREKTKPSSKNEAKEAFVKIQSQV